MSYAALLVGLITSLGLLSCSSLPPAPRVPFSFTAFQNDQRLRKEKFAQVEGKVDILLKGGGRSISGGGQFWSEGEKGARLEVRGPLGRVQYQLSVVGKELVAFYPTENFAYLDSSTGEAYAREVFGSRVNLYRLRQLWLGILPLSVTETEMEKVSPVENGWRVSLNRGEEVWDVTFKHHPPVLGEIDVRGPVRWKMKWDDFEDCCENEKTGIFLAHATVATFQNENAKLSVDWDELKPYPKSLGENFFPVILPANTKKVRLQ